MSRSSAHPSWFFILIILVSLRSIWKLGEFLSEINPKRLYLELPAMARRLKKLYMDGSHLSQTMSIFQTQIALVGNYTLSFLQTPLEFYLEYHLD